MGVHYITKRWVTCDRCGREEENTVNDLLPPKWVKIYFEEAPDYNLPQMHPNKWKDVIKFSYELVFCIECYKDFKFIFRKKKVR